MRFDIICIAFARLIFMDLNPCRKRLGVSRGSFGDSWGPLEGVLGRPWDVFFRLGPVLGAMWRMMSFLGWFRKALGKDFH